MNDKINFSESQALRQMTQTIDSILKNKNRHTFLIWILHIHVFSIVFVESNGYAWKAGWSESIGGGNT